MRLKPATLYALWHTASAFALPVTPGRSRKGLSSRRHASTIGPEAPSNEKPGPKPPPLATIPPPTPSTPPSLSVPLICAVSALQSSTVTPTWDADDHERKQAMQRNFKKSASLLATGNTY